ncbi:MAG: acyltransferase [Bacteroidetes bacterium]|nr:acyltransferase [Bacteroidota bacterium]
MNKALNISVLDSLRAFAALSVCLFHFICTTTGFISDKIVLDIFHVGQYGVQTFFVISGFIIPWSMFNAKYELKNFFIFFLKRLIRLEPPYVVSIIIALIILYLREHFLGKTNSHIQISCNQILLHFGYLIPWFHNYKWLNEVYWTLAIEFQYYLLIAFLFIPLVKKRLLMRVFLYVLFLFSGFVSDLRILLHWLPFFLMGIVTFLYTSNLIKKNEFYLTLFCCVIVGLYLYPIFSLVFSAIPVISILLFSEWKIKILDDVGKFSYSLYLIHPLIGLSFINILSHNAVGLLHKFLIILGGLALTFLSSWLMYRFIELPSKRFSTKLNYKK